MKAFFLRIVAKSIYKIINSATYRKIRLEGNAPLFELVNKNGLDILSMPEGCIIHNPQYITIGKKFQAMHNLRIEAWDEYEGQRFTPSITIGDNVIFNTDCHVGCINEIRIGDNVLIASRVYISDHFHGEINEKALKIPPRQRPLVSRGPVIIEDNVWVGEGVCILPGVTIGKIGRAHV